LLWALTPTTKTCIYGTEEEVYKAAATQGPGDLHALGMKVLILRRSPGPRRKDIYLLAGLVEGQMEVGERGSRGFQSTRAPKPAQGFSRHH